MSAYQDLGIANTSMQEVARRADLAAGTVLYHFPDRDELVKATMADLVEKLEPPSELLFDPDDDLEMRIGKLVEGLFALWSRTHDWYLVEVESEFNSSMEALTRTALGTLGDDDLAVRTVMALTSPPVADALASSGFSSDASIHLITEMLVSWLTGTRSAGGEK